MVNLLKIFIKAAVRTIEHDGVEHAGYMSYLTILSIFPLIVFIIALAGFVGASGYGIEIVNFMIQNLPEHFIDALKPRINEIISGPPQGLLTLSILGVIWTASSAVEGLRTILNRAFRVEVPPPYILRRLLSIVQFLFLIGLIFFSMFVLIFLPLVYDYINSIELISDTISQAEKIFALQFLKPVWSYFRSIALTVTLVFSVATIYYIIPNAKMKFRSIIPGSILVVFLWVLMGKTLSNYISSFNQFQLVYGGLGGIIISLVFFYCINLIFIYGAEFNYLIHIKKNI